MTYSKNALAVQPQVKILSPVQGQVLEWAANPDPRTSDTWQRRAIGQCQSIRERRSGDRHEGSQTHCVDGSRQSIELTWQGHLPADNNLQIQVLCATRDKLVGSRYAAFATSRSFQCIPQTETLSLAAGVSQYRDSRIPSLSLGASNAQAMLEAVLANAATLYDVVPWALTDSV
ncbi:MAG: hypothetical protein R3C56_16815 [Pirellulaceae bacterium]